MKRLKTAVAVRRRGECGQVLILALVALILVIMAILLLFDVQTIIRGKVKAQNAVDAAALTGAEWQKHSLNLIGELNLVRATGTLISDPFFAKGIMNDPHSNASEFFADIQPIDPEEFTRFPEKKEFYNEDGSVNYEKLVLEIIRVEKQKRYLDALDRLVSQLQTRISFVGPLIGFGAAQQAAKNNGISYDKNLGEFFISYMNLVGNDGIYDHITPVFVNDYAWRTPYLYMLESILDYSVYRNDFTDKTENRAYGLAAGTKIEFAGMPTLVADPPTDLSYYLGQKSTYEMILARDWCGLDKLLRLDFSGNWWGDFDCDFNQNFSGQSEILPLHIAFSESINPYETATEENALNKYLRSGQRLFTDMFNREEPYQYTVDDDVVQREETEGGNRTFYTYTKIAITVDQPLETYNDQDADRRYDLLPRLSWATFDEKWKTYGSDKSDWEEYLRGDFKPGMDYFSGAVAFFETRQDTVTVSGAMGRPRHGNRPKDVGQVFSSMNTRGDAQRISSLLREMDNGAVGRIMTDAEAKPLGRIRCADGTFLRPFEAGRMILPVFTETALIPIAMEPVEGFSMLDIEWLYFLTEFIPLLSGSPSLMDSWMRAAELYPNHLRYFQRYFYALVLLGDPGFRQTGIDWLDTVRAWGRDENGKLYPVARNRDWECVGKPGGGGGGISGGIVTKGGPSKLH